MEELADIGRKVSKFVLLYALITSFITYCLVSAGYTDIPRTTAFLPVSWFSDLVSKVSSKLKYVKNATASEAAQAMGVAAAVAALEFGWNLATGFLSVMDAVTSVIPYQYWWLVPALHFVGAFLQLCVWIYWGQKLAEFFSKISGLVRIVLGG